MRTSQLTKIVLLLSLCACASTSCYIRITDEAREELKMTVQRKFGDTTSLARASMTFNPEDFTGIQLDGSMDVVFKQVEGAPRVRVQTEADLVDSLLVDVVEIEGERMLRIHYSCKTYTTTFHKAWIEAPVLTRVVKRGSGDFKIKGDIKGTSLTIESNGSGDVSLDGVDLSETLALHTVGSGDIDCGRAVVRDLSISQLGSGDVEVDGVGGSISVVSLGSGDVDAGGFKATEEGDFTQQGSGQITYNISDTVYIWEKGKKKNLKTVSVVL